MGSPLIAVQDYGQSIWYDNISRKLIRNGEIQKLIQAGVMGITSNPTIFEKAIAESAVYDNAIMNMLDADANTIYEALAVEDIQAAADLLRPIYDRTDGQDGYISLEVSPLIADDTQTTIAEAERLNGLVGRPNVMIKIPATEPGIPAIEETIARGINVNVTLIFSVSVYAEVVEAYLRGLERRLEQGQDVSRIASVASFFLSRIDSMVDQQLNSNILAAQGRDLDRVSANRKLLGTAAIASAKLAYQHFKRIFEGDRFASLRDANARVQRPLWASTSTKNPAYPDTMYVDALIGAHTVNTLPPATLHAFADHGKVSASLEHDLDQAEDTLDMLAEVGVDMDLVTQSLQADGVDKFASSFHNLMAAIDGKRQMLKAGVMERQEEVLGAFTLGVNDTIANLADAPQHIWGRNVEWWKRERQHKDIIRERLGWLEVFDEDRIDRQRLKFLQGLVQAEEFKHVVLLGMGGSSIAAEMLARTFGPQEGFPELLVLDSTVPAAILKVEASINLRETLFIVASKTGTTTETMALFDYFYQKVVDTVDIESAGDHFIAITDPGTQFVALSHVRQLREIFENPPDIGGRYAALSYFGMVPAAAMGLDLDRLFASAEHMLRAIDEVVPANCNPALRLGVIMGYLARAGLDKVSILSSETIAPFGDWLEQLLAESTGKEGTGLVPVVGATIGLPHDYDDDRLIVYLRLDSDTVETDQQLQQLCEAGHPMVTIRLRDRYDLAGEFLRWEFATAVAGHLLKVNPFDEPNVRLAKEHTKTLLEGYIDSGVLPSDAPFFTENNGLSLYTSPRLGNTLQDICRHRNFPMDRLEGLLAAHISLARSGRYIAILAYLTPHDVYHQPLEDIRRHLRHTTRRAVTLGYGPRYLHSTGQLHKGGPNSGVFIVITADDDQELPIPSRLYSFNILKLAQAQGDVASLLDLGRRVVQLHISGDIQAGLQKFSQAIEAAEAKII